MSALESFYFRCSPSLQNLMVTLKGLHHQYQHRSGEYHGFRRELAERRAWDRDQFLDYQAQRIQQLISDSARYVRHYRNSFGRLGVDPESIWTQEDLIKLPLLDKQTVRANPLDFVDSRYPLHSLMRIQTSGTTGSPLQVYTTRSARRYNIAFFDDFIASWGADPEGKRAVFAGKVIAPPDQPTPPFWRHSLYQRTTLFSSFHLQESNLQAYVNALRELSPELIDSYPSSLYPLARHILERGPEPHVAPRLIITSSETLYEEQRRAIEEAFGAQVADQYGSVEMVGFIAQCPYGRYHVRPDYGVVEVLKDGRPAAPGEEGELVCTGFVNPVMPLIRYRIGDVASLSKDECECGLSTPIIERLVGRQDDAVVTPSGRRVSRLGPVLRNMPVREAQYVQTDPDRLVVRMVTGAGYGPNHTQAITRELRKRLGNEIKIAFEFVDDLPRGNGGKLRTIISLIKPSTKY